jgi:hypothetical protein
MTRMTRTRRRVGTQAAGHGRHTGRTTGVMVLHRRVPGPGSGMGPGKLVRDHKTLRLGEWPNRCNRRIMACNRGPSTGNRGGASESYSCESSESAWEHGSAGRTVEAP